jgi:hypothetical protein
VINDLDKSIRQLFDTKVPSEWDLAKAKISFERPDQEWSSQIQEYPVVNIYLYDIRQNNTLQTAEPLKVFNNTINKVEQWPAPKRIDCLYCVTAWISPQPSVTQASDEHKLLGDTLKLLLNFSILPQDVLENELRNPYVKYPTVVSTPDDLKNQTEFWSTLNQVFKPSIHYTVTLSIFPYENGVVTVEPAADIQINTQYKEDQTWST